MNYAEEQLQNAINDELEEIKLKNKKLLLENEKLKVEIENLMNQKEYLKGELSEKSKAKIAESEDPRAKDTEKIMSDNENLKQIIKILSDLL
jgi:Ni,Fe-hydrogenase III component G